MVQVGLIMIYSITLCPGPLIPALSTAIDLMWLIETKLIRCLRPADIDANFRDVLVGRRRVEDIVT